MLAYLIEWLNLFGRWFHMIVGIAWIGASFYFVWLDNHLQAVENPEDTEKGVGGEIWSVHGGGFYHAQKYQVAPPKLPDTLHWFKWEAYTTWLSGMFLLILMYWYGAEIYLIDPNVAALSKPVAVLIGMAFIVAGWFAYDWLCHSRFGDNEKQMAAIMFIALSIASFVLCQLFSGRGAYMHFGAMLGTIMVANVFFVIIPGQKDLVAAKAEGRKPDPIHGIRGKQRSVHNTYFTLPVLFVMISNHYALTYSHEFNWLILIAISFAGALIRIYFVARHKGEASFIPLVLAAIILAAVVTMLAPATNSLGAKATVSNGTSQSDSGNAASPEFDSPNSAYQTELAKLSADESLNVTVQHVSDIMQARCAGCHAAAPTQPGFYAAPQGVLLETEEQIVANSAAIYQQSVRTRAMPIGNLTKMTEQERGLVGRWFDSL